MLRSFPSLALLLTPLLWGCHAAGAPEAPPWAVTFGGDGPITSYLAVDPSGAVAMAGSFQTDIDLGGGTLNGVLLDDDVYVGMFDAAGDSLWSGATGSIGPQEGTGVAFDPDGDVIVLGNFTDELSFGKGKITALQNDAFMAKLDRTGKATWVKHWSGDDGGPSGAGTIFPTTVAATSDGITFGGGFNGSIGFGGAPLENTAMFTTSSFVARVDHDGKHIFSLAFGGQQHQVGALVVDGGGDVYVTGVNQGQLEIGGATFDASNQTCEYVTRLGSDGTPRWAFQIGNKTSEQGDLGTSSGTAIALDANGDLYVAGSYAGAIQIDRFELSAFKQSGFVLKVSGDGKPLWVHDFPNATLGGVGIDDDGRVVVGGFYGGPSDFGGGMLPELDTNGAFITTLEPSKGKHQGTLVLGVPSFQSTIDRLVVTGKDVIVTGNFIDAIALPGTTLTEGADNGYGLNYVARINL